tara:strand:- start:9511 stop:10374 length:864 start_codon:yes stop_codon:yes gene_type:complete
MQLISEIKDNNIFHIFFFDIIKYYDPKYKNVYINSERIENNKKKKLCQKWRLFVMKKLYNNVEYLTDISCTEYNSKNISPTIIYKGYNFAEFIKYKPHPHLCKIYHKIISNKTLVQDKYILLNQREIDDRYLYDYNTKLKLEDFLFSQKLKYPLKVCNFSNMTPEEQYEICNNCVIFISAHGAGCTNLIFTPKTAPFTEINFRKHWYCNEVCNDHFNGKISINEKCNGFKPYFHKADYHNLCYLIGKKYLEIEAIEYGEGFNNRNPISKKKIYIDGHSLIEKIHISI